MRTFAGNHLLDKEGGDGEEIDMVGDTLAGLHRRDVGIDQHRLDALFAEGLQRLGAGIVELSGLAYLESARAEHEHLLYLFIIELVSHFSSLLRFRITGGK